MTINMKTIRENWMIIGAVATLATGTMKAKWTMDALDKRVTVLETKVAALEAANLIRQGAAEVWRARGLIGPAPAPSGGGR